MQRRPRSTLPADKSSKAGKDSQLLVAGVSPDEQLFLPEADDKGLFLQSLVTNVPTADRLLKVPMQTEAPHRSLNLSTGGRGHVPSDQRDVRAASAEAAVQPPVMLHDPPAANHANDGAERTVVAIDGEGRHAQLISFVLSAWAHKSGLPSRARACTAERTVCSSQP